MTDKKENSPLESRGTTVDTSAIAQHLDSLESKQYQVFDANFFSQRSRRSTKLIESDPNGAGTPARREWYSYDLKENLYISTVEIFSEGYSDYHETELSFIDTFSKSKIGELAKSREGKFTFNIGRFIDGFGFKPPSTFIGSPKLKSVRVSGLRHSELESLISSYEDLEILKGQVAAECDSHIAAANSAKEELNETAEAVAEKKQEEVRVDSELEALRQSLEQLSDSATATRKLIASQTDTIAEKQKTLVTLDEQIDKSTLERKNLAQATTAAESKLSQLQRDIYLFPSEIAGYVKQGAYNVWVYLALSAIPFFVICAVTYKLFSNSEALLQAFLLRNDIKILDYLISRIPYAIISIAILTVCYSLLYRLFAEIININRRKQDLFKVSIIATDVSVASQANLGLTEAESYFLRTQTKMELLRSC
jgi:hypothetical protein